MAAWCSGLLGDQVPHALALSPGLEAIRLSTLPGCRLAVTCRGEAPLVQERTLRREEGAGTPPAAGALGRAEGASADSSGCSWGLHTGPCLRPSTRLDGWPRTPPSSPHSQSFVLSSSDKKWPIA